MPELTSSKPKIPYGIIFQLLIIVVSLAVLIGSYKTMTLFLQRDVDRNTETCAKTAEKTTTNTNDINELKIHVSYIRETVTEIKTMLVKQEHARGFREGAQQ